MNKIIVPSVLAKVAWGFTALESCGKLKLYRCKCSRMMIDHAVICRCKFSAI
jgi:hypothetical protein